MCNQSKTHRQSSSTNKFFIFPSTKYPWYNLGTPQRGDPVLYSLIGLRVHICNIRLLKLIKSGQCSCSSHSSQDVCSCALEKGWDSFILQNLHRAVQRSRIFDRLSRGHHHPSTDRINGVRRQSR